MCFRIQVEVGVGRLSVDLVVQGDIWSLIYVDVEKGYVNI